MAPLTREQLIGSEAVLLEVAIPELGGVVVLRRLKVAERDAARDSAPEGKVGYNIVAASLEEPLLSLDEVQQLPIPIYERLAGAVWDHNNYMVVDGGDGSDPALAGEVDELAGTGDAEKATATFPASG